MYRDEASLLDAAKFASNILEPIEGIDQTTLANDLRTQSAVLYQITILGEAVKRLSQAFRQQHPEIGEKIASNLFSMINYNFL